MSYGFDLVRLPVDADRNKAYQDRLKRLESEDVSEKRLGPIDPAKEERKQRLAAALMKLHPALQMFKHDYSQIARARSMSEEEARRIYRNLELNEKQLSFQILLFDDTAGASFSFAGEPHACANALRSLWDCLRLLESEGSYSTYDPQIGKVLNLDSDFETVLRNACGVNKEKQ